MDLHFSFFILVDTVDFNKIANRVAASNVEAARKKSKKQIKKVSKPKKTEEEIEVIIEPVEKERDITEYSCRFELVFTADFLGKSSKSKVMKVLQDQVLHSIKSAVRITSNELDLEPTKVTIKPVSFDCAVNSPNIDDIDY